VAFPFFRGALDDRPSAVIVLGTLSGFIAGSLYLIISAPLILAITNAESVLALRNSGAAAKTVEQWLDAGVVLTPKRTNTLGASWVRTETLSGQILYDDSPPAIQASIQAVCRLPVGEGFINEGSSWSVRCLTTQTHKIAVGTVPPGRLGSEVMYWTMLLSIVVGLVTSLVQARLLRPLTYMSQALRRVGEGERGVRLDSTGLSEFDAVVDRINEAAENVDARVDAIAARISIVQEMARLVAHEVRNPLQSLEVLTTLIALEESARDRRAISESIRREIANLEQVVQRLLRDSVHKGALRLKRRIQPLPPIAKQLHRLRVPEAQARGIKLTLGVMSWRPITADAAMLSRSLENVVNNALRMVPAPGGEVRISIAERGDQMVLTVDDNGPGVDPEIGERIFEEDVTDRAEGQGLGLALSKAVLVAHGGSIRYTESPMGGARFQMELPMEDETEDPSFA